MLLPTADDDSPNCRPVSVKLRVSATCTNIEIPPRLSITVSREILPATTQSRLRTFLSNIFGTLAHFSSSVQFLHSHPRSKHPRSINTGSPPFWRESCPNFIPQ